MLHCNKKCLNSLVVLVTVFAALTRPRQRSCDLVDVTSLRL